MPRRPIESAPTLEDIDNFFSLKSAPSQPSSPSSQQTDTAAAREHQPRRNRIRGRMIDELGNPITPQTFLVRSDTTKPSYKHETEQLGGSRAYVSAFRDQQKHMNSLSAGMGRMSMNDGATLDQLETHSMTGSTISSNLGHAFNMRPVDSKVHYAGYRQGVYNDKLPITKHRDNIVSTIEANHCTIIQGMTGCGKTTQVPQYILDESAKTGRRCNIAVTQPRRIAAISIARRVCAERGWTLGTYCGYKVAREKEILVDKTMITYMTTGILLQKLINERNLDSYTHIILDEVHERDQDTDLALLIVKKFVHTVSPQVKIVLMSATFDCEVFANYFSTEIRGEMQKAPAINLEGRGFKVHQFHWSDPLLSNLMSIPRFEDHSPTVFPEAMTLAVKLISHFDRVETEEQQAEIAEGKLVSRGTVLVFLPGYAEIQDLTALLEKEEGFKGRKLKTLPLHSSITLEEQGKVFDKPHDLYRKVILSTNIAESSITVPDIKYVIDFCLTKNLQTDRDTNMTCLKLEWASKANCKQRMGRAGRVSNGQVYRLIHKAFYRDSLQEYGTPEMSRCPLTQLILRVKKLGPEEPRYILSTALDPPDMNEIGKSILLLKEAGALADPEDLALYNPFDGQLTFVGEVLASLPLNIELGKLLVFGHMLGLLPECLIVAAAMHTRPIFQQPFNQRLDSFRHRLKWDRGMHSDSIATVNAYKEWDKLREQEYFMRAPNAETKWCQDNFLQKKTLNEVQEVIRDLTRRLEEHGISPRASVIPPHLRRDREEEPAHEHMLLKVALACAFYPNYFGQMMQDETDAGRQLSGLSPMNTVYMKGLPNNQGILYKRQVERMISEQIPGCKLQASFENTKCYLEFSPAPGDCGKIPNAMYVSLRLSQQRERLELSLFDDQDAFNRMQHITESQRAAALDQGRLDTNRMFRGTKEKLRVDLPKQILPSNMITCIELLVVHVEECGHFWGHEVDTVKMNQLFQLQSELNNPAYLDKSAAIFSPVAGMLCIAPYQDQYFRGKIVVATAHSAQVFFVDYGNMEQVKLGEIRQLLPKFRELEYQAVECAFTEISPPRSSQGDGWPPAVNQFFANLLLEKQVYCEIYSVDKGVLRLGKVVDANAEHISFHDVLLSKGLVELTPESFTSEQNHQLRYPDGSGNQRANNLQEAGESEWGFRLEEEMPRLNKSNRRQTISGPYSPVEMKFHCLSGSRSMRDVRIEPSSVNAIALDEDPSDKHDRLMIAASMSVNNAGNKIIARETTLMPNIHGLPALMCLLFAPSIIIRRDSRKKSYTGAICGLGMDPRTGGSAFPDHDVEIEFDTHFDVDDVMMINQIKMAFNICLGGHNRVDDMAMSRCQDLIRRLLKQLLNRKRPSREKVYSHERLQWRQLPASELLKHELEDTSAEQVHLFRLMSVPQLETNNLSLRSDQQRERAQLEFLKEHCKSLTMITSGPRNINRSLSVTCELCKVRVTSTKELQVHLSSKLHRAHEFELFGNTM